tara:strand:+ start:1298 stop:3121 length:1824 start_codon:yes stop_codon:yes gene_type:complete
MCGILGSIPRSNNKIFKKSLNKLNHRGPDGEGIYHFKDEISLGHKRLSVIDLSDNGYQPMSKYDRYYLIFNGEIYNYLELKKELEGKGYLFKSRSDTEVLLYSFIEWGSDCVNRLNGMWAFAIWDKEIKSLFLSRDRLGEKPLYYSFFNNKLYFSSEQKALLPFLEKVEISSDFNNLVNNPYSNSNKTLFSKINKFPPAHNGIYVKNKLTFERYWSPKIQAENLSRSYSEKIEYLNDLIYDSCKIRLRSDVPISTALSGGIDSSLVASFVREIYLKDSNLDSQCNNQTGFNLSFPDSVMDENYASKQIADKLNINLETVIVDKNNIHKNLEKVCYLFEDIQEVNPLPHYYLYKRIKEKGFSVSLDGHGGDELFCGYESSILHAMPDNLFNYKSLKKIYKTYCDVHPKNEFFKKLSPSGILLYLTKSYVKNFINRKSRDNATKNCISKLDSLSKHLFELTFETVLPTLLRNYDRYSMMSGVEIRMPLIDYRIVEFAFSSQWDTKINKGFTKSILRDQITNKIPPNIVNNKVKIGFAPPIYNWIKGPLREYILDELNSIKFVNSRLVNPKKVKNKLYSIIHEDQTYSHYYCERIWKEFSTYIWEKLFLT